MLAANAVPLPQSTASLGLEVAPLPVLDLQTQPYRISQINQFDRSFADSQLKHEAAASRESQRFLRRVTSKLSRPDTTFTAAALARHVESNGTAVVAQIYIERLEAAAGNSSEKFEIPGDLIITAAKNSSLELVKLLASFSSINSLGLALNIAILNRDQPVVRVLLENGGDTDHLPTSTLSSAAVGDLQIFQLILQAPRQLPHHKFGYLCAEAIHNGRPEALAILLRRLPDYTILAESSSKWNRDMLLETAIASQYESAFFAVAAATASWPLLNGQLFFHVLDCARPLIVQDMLYVLLGLHRSSSDTGLQTQLESLFCRGIEDGLDDILQLLVNYGLQISARVIFFACERCKRQSLEILLGGHIQGDEAILSSIQSAFGKSAESLRERTLLRLLQCHNRGPWIQQELLRAVFVNRPNLIDPLINSGALVDFNSGQCLRFAVTANNVLVVKALLAHDVALSTLQTIFPLIRREEPLSRRLVTKLFLRKGVSGDCVDVIFNELLCDYSPTRDAELLEVFTGTTACCQVESLLIAMEHHDSVIFDKLRLSSTVRYNGVTEWFEIHHHRLFDQLCVDDGSSRISSSYLKLFLHISGTSETLCAYGEKRKYTYFHRLLQHRAHDRELLGICLNSMSEVDNISLMELALTASWFPNAETTKYILSSKPFANSEKVSPAKLLKDLNASASGVEIPEQNLNITRFPVDRLSSLKIFFKWCGLEGKAMGLLTTRLLRRHLEELHICVAESPWPLPTVEFLVSQPMDTASPDFEACLTLANSSRQWEVLQQLLAIEMSLSVISNSFGADLHALTMEGLEIIFESTNMSCLDESHIPILQQSFDRACLSHDYPRSLLLASKFPHKFEITNVLDVLKAQKKDDHQSEWFCEILGLAAPCAADLAILWQHVEQDPLEEKTLCRLQALLKAGVTGSLVSDTLLSSGAKGKHTIVSLILEHWDVDRCRSGRASFDFKKRLLNPRGETRVAEQPSSRLYYQALGESLIMAVTRGDLKMCQLLLTAGAPLIHNEKVITTDVVKSVDASTLFDFVSMCAAIDDFGTPGVDFALLEAVKCGRSASIRAMVKAGGSVLAYDCECLRIAIDKAFQGQMEILALLTALRPTEDTLSFIVDEATPKLGSQIDKPSEFCEIFGLLHARGLVDAKYYNPAFATLCSMKSTKWDQAQCFLNYGAHVAWSDGACMREAWRHGNLQLFPQLFHLCQEQGVLNKVFDDAVSDHTSGQLSGYLQANDDAIVVLAPLLVTGLAQSARSKALSKVASLPNPSIALLELMLETGARLHDDEGETLYRLCCRNLGQSLIASCRPTMTARLQAMKILFNSKASTDTPTITFTNLEKDGLPHPCLRLILWPDMPSNAFVPTQDHVALFDTMLDSSGGSSSYELVETFLLTPQGLGFISTYCAQIGCSAMEVLLSAEIMASKQDHQDRRIELIVRALQVSAPRVLAEFELQRANCEQFFDALSDQENHATEHQSKSIPMYLPVKPDSPGTSHYTDADGFNYEFGVGKSKIKQHQQQGLSLSRNSMNRLLFVALKRRRLTSLISTLLDCGAEPDGIDSQGRSALYLATSLKDCYCSAMKELINRGAAPDDGSLHLATCNQDHGAMEALVGAGHSLGHRSPLHQDSTVLEAFLRYDHPESKKKTFVSTLKILLKDADWGTTVWQARPNLSGVALEGRWPFECVSALLEFRPITGVKTTLLRRGRFRYSLLGAVKRWDTDVRLTDGERQKLISRLADLGFRERYYASEGQQPKDAVGIPERLLDADSRSRLLAWQEKECSVCADKPEEPKDIYAHLSTTCMPKHGWQNEIICKDCLQQCLESRMFPTEDERFPSDKVLCWAPNCGEVLSHPTIQKYTDAKRFAAYDEALCQKLLHAGQSMAKCSRKDCKGAIWLDPVSDKNVTVFNCPVCKHRTCVQCNQPYKNHANKPCPAGEAAKSNARRKEEEKLTANFMKKEKKCPQCKMPYHRTEGCDHITCGKDTHSAAKSCKFCPPFLDCYPGV